MSAPLTISSDAARRFMRQTLLLDSPAPDVATALFHHAYIQIDPINVTGRMHDLILCNRVKDYREGDLMRYLHGSDKPLPPARRYAFEHHLPPTGILVAFPVESWPHLLNANASRSRRPGSWSGRLTPRERELSDHIIDEIATRGPLRSSDFADDRRSRGGWGTMRLVKSAMQKLFFHGRLMIAGRTIDNHRLYDLPERILSTAVLLAKPPPKEETDRWLVLTQLRQRRLVLLKKKDLRFVEGDVQAVKVEGCPTLHCLREDLPLLEMIPITQSKLPLPIRLLAPLDPLIYDRRVTSALWNFNYTWEVYTPPAKRVRGYYALPILAGTELVGHVDPKAHREQQKLKIVSRSVRRGHKVKDAVHARSLARSETLIRRYGFPLFHVQFWNR